MKPIGALQQLGRKFVRIAKWETIEALERFVAGEEFLRLFATVPPAMRVTVIKAYQQANEKCAKRKPLPEAGTRGVCKTVWDALTVKRFATTWAKHARTHERHKEIVRAVAREMGITEGSAAVAYSRFIKRGAPATRGVVENASRKAQEARRDPRRPMGSRPLSESVRLAQAAA